MAPRRRTYQRRPRLWRRPSNGVYYIVWPEEGNLRRLSTKTYKRVEAEASLSRFLEDLESGHAARPPISLHEGIRDWLADRERPRQNLQPTTLRGYRHFARVFLESLPTSLAARDATPARIRQFLDEQEDAGIAPPTLRKQLGCLSMVFRFLLREGHVHGNPCNAIQIRAKSRRHPAMTEEEYATLRSTMLRDLEAAQSAQERADFQELVDLGDVLWHSGLRYIEGVRLRWDDIDLEKARWTIRSPETKGGEQTLPLHQRLLPILLRRRLLGSAGPFRDYWPLLRLWSTFKRRHGEFRGWSWHRMRHAFVTRYRARGLEAAAMALARHKTPAMSLHYTHLDEGVLRQNLDAI